ncbi:MAG: class I SAM-dependent methyltransferase [Candidatus Marinimicrobia bacterium]|nr:class I SAM-dependent methyltransferase [Candidatus Neomarinimicrobiota bacterium]
MGKKIIDGLESHIELDGFTARNYDLLMDLASLGMYPKFIGSSMKSLGIKSGETILDLGCGTGRNLELIMHRADYKGDFNGIDIGEEMLAQAKKRFPGRDNVHLEIASILEPYPFKKEFDHITCSFILHGFSHEQRIDIAKNAAKHLKPGGIFSFLDWTPAKPEDWPGWFRFFFKKIECPIAYEFIKHDYAKEFEEAGLELLDIHPKVWGYARVVRLKKK